jgi:hypothetical protein
MQVRRLDPGNCRSAVFCHRAEAYKYPEPSLVDGKAECRAKD